ncbi:MAG TPA: DedA family protein [Acetobacteraceae bacterium]|nr:DedA family protein [Acetobacteraceae bacterium]
MIDHLVEFLRAHAAWAPAITFGIAFFKSLALVSLVVPGTTIMLAVGALIGASGLPFTPIWIAISVGAALGDWISYWIGIRYGDRIKTWWPFSRHPDLLPRGERFFRRWGWLSIVFCRFFEPLRATVPLLCGVFRMKALTFQLTNWPSAFLWAATLLGPGKIIWQWLF